MGEVMKREHTTSTRFCGLNFMSRLRRRVEGRHFGAATLSRIAAPLLLVMSACGSGLQGGGTSASDSRALTTTPKAPTQYSYQFVDVPGATATRISAINDWGATVGDFTNAAGAQHAFIRARGGDVTTVDIPGAASTTLRGINDVGVAVGFYSVETPQGPNAVAFHGFKRTPDGVITVVDLPGAGDSALLGINNIGDIVGQYDLADQSVGGSFVLEHGRFTTLQDPPGAAPFNVFAVGINDLGVISGSYLGVDGNEHAFLLRTSTYETFDDVGATVTALAKLNDRGQAAGVSDVSGGFVLNTATLSISTLIACPDGVVTFAIGINNRGQVTGRCKLSADTPPRAFHSFIATPVGDD
jgi:hypothetical protein